MPEIDIDKVDEVIHGRLRLAVMAYLSGARSATFPELQEKTGATNGNLSTHLRKLEDAGYVTVVKDHHDRRPRTTVTMSEAGRTAWIAYLDELKGLLGG